MFYWWIILYLNTDYQQNLKKYICSPILIKLGLRFIVFKMTAQVTQPEGKTIKLKKSWLGREIEQNPSNFSNLDQTAKIIRFFVNIPAPSTYFWLLHLVCVVENIFETICIKTAAKNYTSNFQTPILAPIKAYLQRYPPGAFQSALFSMYFQNIDQLSIQLNSTQLSEEW